MIRIFIFLFSLFFSACSWQFPLFMKKVEPKEEIVKESVKEIEPEIVVVTPKKEVIKPVVFINPKISPIVEEKPKPVIKPKPIEKKEIITPPQVAKKPIKKTRLDIHNLKFKKIAFVGDSHIASDYMPNFFRKELQVFSLGFIPAILPRWHDQFLVSYKNIGFKTEYLINTRQGLSFGGINANCLSNCQAIMSLAFFAKNLEYIEFKNNLWEIKTLGQNIKDIRLSIQNAKLGGFITNNDVFVDNLGINGASIYNYSRIDDYIEKQVVKKLDYDLVIFSFGTNESVSNSVHAESFKRNYKKIIDIFRAKNTKVVLLIPPEPTLYTNKQYIKGKNNDLVKELIKSLAKELNCYVFDIDSIMQKEGGKQVWIEQGKSLKNTHLSKKGYEYVATKLLNFLNSI